ncbi:hypothetical protein ACROYT_G010180 [Oculina patagonica]
MERVSAPGIRNRVGISRRVEPDVRLQSKWGSGVGKRGPSKCPDGYKLYNNVCYKYFPGPVNWVQASEKCAADFSTLASVNSQAEDFFIKTVLTSGGVSDAWIGVSDLNNHGVMSWLDGSEPLFMNWDYY